MADKDIRSDFIGKTTAGSDDIEKKEFEQLSAKTAEILQEAALAHKRIAKHHEEIEQLKAETRAMLTLLRAA